MSWTRKWLAVQAWCDLARYDRQIARGGFPVIHRALTEQGPAERRGNSDVTGAVCDAVDLAACFYWKSVHCLQRSVVTVRLLRRRGIAADLVIGYRPSPMFFHAWVEVDGQVVNDSPAYAEQLIVLYRQAGCVLDKRCV